VVHKDYRSGVLVSSPCLLHAGSGLASQPMSLRIARKEMDTQLIVG
jgi:hypothetical protein